MVSEQFPTRVNGHKIEIEQENDGRWIIEVPSLPGVMAYGVTKQEAFDKAMDLAEVHFNGK